MNSDRWGDLRYRLRRMRRHGSAPLDGPLFWVLLGGAALLVGGYAALCVVAGPRLPGDARVDGVAVGGLQPAAAVERLRARLPERMAEPIRVTGGGVSQDVEPRAAGLTLDAAASVRAAGGGHSYTPRRLWRYYLGDHDVPAEVSVDRDKLREAVGTVGVAVDEPLTEGDVLLTGGRPTPVEPADGRRLRQGDTARALVDRVARAGQVRPVVDLPVTTLRPTISSAQVARALRTYGVPLTSAPVRLSVGEQSVTAPPRLYAAGVDLVPDDGKLRPEVDVDALFKALAPVIDSVPGAPQPARVVVRGGRPVVVSSRKGVTFDRTDLEKKFLVAALAPAGKRVAAVRGVSADPAFTTADARALKVRRRVGTYTSRFGYSGIVGGGQQNIARGADRIDGTLLKPGQRFSFNRAVGEPTAKRGFSAGRSLRGSVFVADPGAGLSQLASTLFNAMLPAGLTPTQRTIGASHSPRFPLGREATVRYGAQDLAFTNDSPYGVLLTASTTGGSPGAVTVSLWSTKRYDVSITASKPLARAAPRVLTRTAGDCAATVGAAGFTIRLQRVLTPVGGGAPRRDALTSVYPVTNSVVCAAPRE
ncbi:vanomycin resistance protein VanB [Marmoricola endophyticus]|uniref:Vanomycin resistance protein VanB n=1 Tax=Marmoricola endophyticus TaxID=2040280 RepID=A0A917BQ45_9ACTN|nr:vanomycin resistance protein VanB [Marmoricola endophyticus]